MPLLKNPSVDDSHLELEASLDHCLLERPQNCTVALAGRLEERYMKVRELRRWLLGHQRRPRGVVLGKQPTGKD